MTIEHNAIPANQRHGIANWVVANLTALNALAVTSNDLHKTAFVTDTRRYYSLAQVGPVVWTHMGTDTLSSDSINNNSAVAGATVTAALATLAGADTTLSAALGGKQATLVSGASIKTVNGGSLLGAGDLTIGLLYDTETRTVTAPNATVPVHGFTANGAEAAIDLLLSPKGDGAILAQIPDSTAAGGNKRGIGAVDFQRTRATAGRVATATRSVVVGGQDNGNDSGATDSFIGGGVNNFIQSTGVYAFIGGGNANYITQQGGVVVGGNTNNAGYMAFVGGGQQNTVVGDYATIPGGRLNTVNTTHGNISGGYNNLVTSNYGTVGGGASNQATGGTHITVAGGASNVASATASCIGGGSSNIASGNNAALCGGGSNTVSGTYSFIGGGSNNIAAGSYGAILAGYLNEITAGGTYASILCGQRHYINASSTSAIAGDWSQSRGNAGAAIVGGYYGQTLLNNFAGQTSDATPAALGSLGGSSSAWHKMTNGLACAFDVEVIATDGTDVYADWIRVAAVKAAGVVTLTTATSAPQSSAGAATWTLAVAADNVNGGVKFTATGQAAKVITWNASVRVAETNI